MRARSLGAVGRLVILSVLVVGSAGTTAPSAPPPTPRPKTVKIVFRDAVWSKVFEWVTETTDKPVITTFKLAGTFSFAGPPDKEYTVPEALSIINLALLDNRVPCVLLERELCFVLRSADIPAGEW